MSPLFTLPGSVKRDPAIERWFTQHEGELGQMAKRWFEVMRGCGADVRETLHDDQPTACVGAAAFAYVAVFSAHVNVGFFRGAELEGPGRQPLEGAGKLMRHAKLAPNRPVDEEALRELVQMAYLDMKRRVRRQ